MRTLASITWSGEEEEGRGEVNLDLDQSLAEDLLVHISEVEDEELIVDATETGGLHRCVLSLIKGFDVNNRIGRFVKIFCRELPTLDDMHLDLKGRGGA